MPGGWCKPEHPVYVTERSDAQPRPKTVGHEDLNTNWVGAGHLKIGDKIKQADGTVGVVANVTTVQQTQEMFNLTVDEAHTFYVGNEGWLVHNQSWRTHEQAVEAAIKAANPGATVARQVSMYVTDVNGVKVRIIADVVVDQGGVYQLIDAKFSSVKDLTTAFLRPTATPNQLDAYDWIKNSQVQSVEVAGGNSAKQLGLKKGASISLSTSVDFHVNDAAGNIHCRTW